jgi:hypothetical protein
MCWYPDDCWSIRQARELVGWSIIICWMLYPLKRLDWTQYSLGSGNGAIGTGNCFCWSVKIGSSQSVSASGRCCFRVRPEVLQASFVGCSGSLQAQATFVGCYLRVNPEFTGTGIVGCYLWMKHGPHVAKPLWRISLSPSVDLIFVYCLYIKI